MIIPSDVHFLEPPPEPLGHATVSRSGRATRWCVAAGDIFPTWIAEPALLALRLYKVHDFLTAVDTIVLVFLVGEEDQEGICICEHSVNVASDERITKPVSSVLGDSSDVVWISDFQPGATCHCVGNTTSDQFGGAPHVNVFL